MSFSAFRGHLHAFTHSTHVWACVRACTYTNKNKFKSGEIGFRGSKGLIVKPQGSWTLEVTIRRKGGLEWGLVLLCLSTLPAWGPRFNPQCQNKTKHSHRGRQSENKNTERRPQPYEEIRPERTSWGFSHSSVLLYVGTPHRLILTPRSSSVWGYHKGSSPPEDWVAKVPSRKQTPDSNWLRTCQYHTFQHRNPENKFLFISYQSQVFYCSGMHTDDRQKHPHPTAMPTFSWEYQVFYTLHQYLVIPKYIYVFFLVCGCNHKTIIKTDLGRK